MSEFHDLTPARVSPFTGHQPAERASRAGQIGVRLFATTLSSVTQVSTWNSGIDALTDVLAKTLGATLPATTGSVIQTADGLLLRTGPEEFLLVSHGTQDLTRHLRQSIASDIGSVTDMSHARCLIRVEGEHCRDTLSKLFAIDLRDAAFPVGEARLTGHHHVSCLLHRLERDRFDMVVFTTYAHDQLSTLIDAALEYGVAVQPAWEHGNSSL